MLVSLATVVLMAHIAIGAPLDAALEPRQSCPSIHIFGARETTAAPGYGTAGTVVNLVLNAYPGSTAEVVNYPACGGQSSCGGASYSSSVQQGTANIASQINSFNAKCPSTQLVVVGYSQGGEISDNAVCGGGDTPQGLTNTAIPINSAALNMIKAVIEMGSPRFRAGASYNVGTCNAYGFSARPAGYSCPSASKLQSYCDSADPYCCTGSDANTHQQYGNKYGQAALTFIKSKLNAGGSTNPVTTTSRAGTTPTTTTSRVASQPTTTAAGNGGNGGSCSAQWGQCGGIGWTGPTCCSSGTCKSSNAYYSQCL